jgi:hypothetical protein
MTGNIDRLMRRLFGDSWPIDALLVMAALFFLAILSVIIWLEQY